MDDGRRSYWRGLHMAGESSSQAAHVVLLATMTVQSSFVFVPTLVQTLFIEVLCSTIRLDFIFSDLLILFICWNTKNMIRICSPEYSLKLQSSRSVKYSTVFEIYHIRNGRNSDSRMKKYYRLSCVRQCSRDYWICSAWPAVTAVQCTLH